MHPDPVGQFVRQGGVFGAAQPCQQAAGCRRATDAQHVESCGHRGVRVGHAVADFLDEFVGQDGGLSFKDCDLGVLQGLQADRGRAFKGAHASMLPCWK
jgi:hypothetical protein